MLNVNQKIEIFSALKEANTYIYDTKWIHEHCNPYNLYEEVIRQFEDYKKFYDGEAAQAQAVFEEQYLKLAIAISQGKSLENILKELFDVPIWPFARHKATTARGESYLDIYHNPLHFGRFEDKDWGGFKIPCSLRQLFTSDPNLKARIPKVFYIAELLGLGQFDISFIATYPSTGHTFQTQPQSEISEISKLSNNRFSNYLFQFQIKFIITEENQPVPICNFSITGGNQIVVDEKTKAAAELCGKINSIMAALHAKYTSGQLPTPYWEFGHIAIKIAAFHSCYHFKLAESLEMKIDNEAVERLTTKINARLLQLKGNGDGVLPPQPNNPVEFIYDLQLQDNTLVLATDVKRDYRQKLAIADRAKVLIDIDPETVLFDKSEFFKTTSYDRIRQEAEGVLKHYEATLKNYRTSLEEYKCSQLKLLITELLRSPNIINIDDIAPRLPYLFSPPGAIAYYLGKPDTHHGWVDYNYHLNFRLPLFIHPNLITDIYNKIPPYLLLAETLNILRFSFEYAIERSCNTQHDWTIVDINLSILYKNNGSIEKHELMKFKLNLKTALQEHSSLLASVVSVYSGHTSDRDPLRLPTANLIYAFGMLIPLIENISIGPINIEIPQNVLIVLNNEFQNNIQQKITHRINLIRQPVIPQPVRPQPVRPQPVDGNTPLHLACKACNFAEATKLLNQGADANISNHDLKTPLEMIPNPMAQPELVKLLLRTRQHWQASTLDRMIEACKIQFKGNFANREHDKKLLDTVVSLMVGYPVGNLMEQYKWVYVGHLNSLKGNYQRRRDNSFTKFEGFSAEIFLPLRIRILFELIIKIEMGELAENLLPKSITMTLKKLKEELLTELETLQARKDLLFIKTQLDFRDDFVKAHAINLSIKINKQTQAGSSYCYHSGFIGHTVYINFTLQDVSGTEKIVPRIDNLGCWAQDGKHERKEPGYYYPCALNINPGYFTEHQAPVYLVNIIRARFMSDSKDAFHAIYGQFPTIEKSVISSWWPAKLIQSSGNCVVKNHGIGLQIRWRENDGTDRFYEWFREYEARHIPLKSYGSKVKAILPAGVVAAEQAFIEEELKKEGITSLHRSVMEGNEGEVRQILEKDQGREQVNAVTENKYTPLHLAAFQGNEAIIKLLLKHGADIAAENEVGANPLLLAAMTGNTKTIEQLQHFETMGEIEKFGERENYTALHLSIQKGDNQAFERLLHETKININAKTKQGYTALHLAAIEGRQDFIKLLIQHEAKVNDTNLKNDTPLMLAALYANPMAIYELLASGADIMITNITGQTPLDILMAQASLMPNDEKVNHCLALLENAFLKKGGLEQHPITHHTPIASGQPGGVPVFGGVPTIILLAEPQKVANNPHSMFSRRNNLDIPNLLHQAKISFKEIQDDKWIVEIKFFDLNVAKKLQGQLMNAGIMDLNMQDKPRKILMPEGSKNEEYFLHLSMEEYDAIAGKNASAALISRGASMTPTIHK